MIRRSIQFVLLLSLLGSGTRCKQEVPNEILIGKLVLEKACGHFVIQVLQGYVDPSKIAREWKDSVNDSTYTNVFAVANFCSFDGVSEGDIFSFQFDPSAPYQNCPICFLAYPSPPVSNFVKNMHKIN